MKKIRTIILAGILSLSSFAAISLFNKPASKVVALNAGEVLDEHVDTISVSDLTMSASNSQYSGLTNQTMVPSNQNIDATFAFSGENTYKSLIFKFKYDVVDTTNSSSNAVRIALDVVPNGDDPDNTKQASKWNGRNSLWIRGDGTYFARYSGGWGYATLAAIPAGLHEVEYGRIAILNESTGLPTGSYYVYYKLDNNLVRYNYNDYSDYGYANMDPTMFLQFSAGNTSNHIYDVSYDDNLTYETPQYVSISDLKAGGNYVGDTIQNKQVEYTYDTTEQPTYKSTALVAKIDYKAVGDSQLHLEGPSAGNWNNAGCAWPKQDHIVIYLNNADGTESGSNAKANYPALVADSIHSMEYGRLAIMKNSVFQNRYHVYFKLDGKVILGVDQAIEDQVVAGGKLFVTGGNNFDFVDAYTLETAKEISVSDLKNGGTPVGNSLFIDAQKNLTFNNEDHKANNSLVFKCKYESFEAKNNQFHLSCAGRDEPAGKDYKWHNASSVILNNSGSKVHLGKSTSTLGSNTWYDINYTMTPGTIYNIEFGRKAVMVGDVFTGKYYVYLKIDDALVGWGYHGIPQPITEGNLVFITADGHNKIYDVAVTPYEEAVAGIGASMKVGFAFDKDGDDYSNVKCVLGAGIDEAIAGDDITAAAHTYGIKVSTSSKTMYYNSDLAHDGGLYYQLINLEDIINNKTRATDVFTVAAYIQIGETKYVSTATKEYSVSTLVDYYLNNAVSLALSDEQVSALTALQTALS